MLKNFEYVHGNKITFDGKFGRVELIYYNPTGEPSHFNAFLYDKDGKTITSSVACGEQEAIIKLYRDYATFCAFKDLDIIN